MDGLESAIRRNIIRGINRVINGIYDIREYLTVNLDSTEAERKRVTDIGSLFTTEFIGYLDSRPREFLAPLNLDEEEMRFFCCLGNDYPIKEPRQHKWSMKYGNEIMAIMDQTLLDEKEELVAKNRDADRYLLEYASGWSIKRCHPLFLFVKAKGKEYQLGPWAFHFSDHKWDLPANVETRDFFLRRGKFTNIVMFRNGDRIDITEKHHDIVTVTKFFYLGMFDSSVLGKNLHIYGTHVTRDSRESSEYLFP